METELQAEQEFVDLAYARLDAMRSDANSMLEGVLDLGTGGHVPVAHRAGRRSCGPAWPGSSSSTSATRP